ncbi:MAG TPA: LCP family protein [Mycobacteriales bacterium]|nr:LCP family protein [Mycobacteriales bacterium]
MTSDLLPGDPGYVPGRGRRAEARRRRKQRQRRLAAGAAVLVLVAAAALTALLVQRGPAEDDPVVEQGRTQQTLLMQVQRAGGGREALASALLAHDPPSATGSVVLLPPQVIVDVPGAGSQQFGRALAAGDPNGSRNALADLLGVQVDGTWVLQQQAFQQLVDAVGGITVEVDVPVVRDNAVVVPQGTQQVDGARALALMTFLADGEPEQSRLARLQEVLDGLLEALPAESTALTRQLTALGEGSASSLPVSELAGLLVGLQESSAADQLQYDTLPVIAIDAGGEATSFRLDAEAAQALVDRALAQSVPAGERQTGNRVLVLNGVGTPGLGEAVRAKLVDADFVFVASRNAERFGYETTQVLVPEATPEAQQLGERIAEALGVAPDVRQADLGTIADAVVIIGADFQP